MDIDYWYIGYIDTALDNAEVNYHHCRTWFRLFLGDKIYSIDVIKNKNYGDDIIKDFDNNNRVVIYEGDNISWCINTKAPIVFQGTLNEFTEWLEKQS